MSFRRDRNSSTVDTSDVASSIVPLALLRLGDVDVSLVVVGRMSAGGSLGCEFRKGQE